MGHFRKTGTCAPKSTFRNAGTSSDPGRLRALVVMQQAWRWLYARAMTPNFNPTYERQFANIHVDMRESLGAAVALQSKL